MNDLFNEFISNITLTPSQQEDALRKYTGVCEKLYHAYYGEGTYDSSKQYLFGSYKTKTNIRPLTESQDVDVLFKIPQSTFNIYDAYTSNGQAALLQEVKNILKEKYTTTDKIKAWGKV
ncbi:MAG TPA: nucleotidyltransferase, partial [Mediterranea massiliensis]